MTALEIIRKSISDLDESMTALSTQLTELIERVVELEVSKNNTKQSTTPVVTPIVQSTPKPIVQSAKSTQQKS